jgi:hypothetical protein
MPIDPAYVSYQAPGQPAVTPSAMEDAFAILAGHFEGKAKREESEADRQSKILGSLIQADAVDVSPEYLKSTYGEGFKSIPYEKRAEDAFLRARAAAALQWEMATGKAPGSMGIYGTPGTRAAGDVPTDIESIKQLYSSDAGRAQLRANLKKVAPLKWAKWKSLLNAGPEGLKTIKKEAHGYAITGVQGENEFQDLLKQLKES